MPANKKHHYVPKFYLKNFSSNEKCIDIYNITSDKIIRNAPLKNQCYKDYLYGKSDGVEKGLGLIECAAAKIFRDIIESINVPPYFTPPHFDLLFFIVIQHNRTRYAIDSLNEMANKFAKQIIRPTENLTQENIDSVTISLTEAGAYSVSLAAQQWHIAYDLHFKLIVAKVGQEFIASDHPAIFYNQLFEEIITSNATGLACKGLQIFLPISPSMLLMFYDKDCYKVGNRKDRIVKITEQLDMESLNQLQIANASENVYFSDTHSVRISDIKNVVRLRRKEKVELNVYPSNEGGKRGKELIVSSNLTSKIGLKLGFVKRLKHANRFRNHKILTCTFMSS